MSQLPIVAVSACLLGKEVRYDGKHKYSYLISKQLARHCQLIPVCPEVEIGLGIPREKIQLMQISSGVRVVNVSNKAVDVTALLIAFAKQFVAKYSLSGLVLQDRSPSCGIGNAKLFSKNNELVGVSSGLFAATVMNLLPSLVVIQESQLQDEESIDCFVQKVKGDGRTE